MEFLQNMMSGIGNAMSSAWSGVSNFFGGLFNGGGGGGGGVTGAVAATTLATGMAVAPPPQQGLAYPSPAVNVHAVNSVPNQVMGALNSSAMQVVGRMGVAGQILGPMVDATMRVSDMQMRANQNGAISCAPPGQPMGPTPNLNGAFNASCGAYQARLAAANEAGAAAMIQRGINQSIGIAGTRALNGIYTPQSSGGVLGDLINRIRR